MKKYKIAILNSHPIQYFGPLYRHLSKNYAIDLTVYYYSFIGANEYYDQGFKKNIKWDIPITNGYKYIVLKNLRKKDQLKGFWKLINFSIVKELISNEYDAIIIHGTNYFTDVLALLISKSISTKVFIRRSIHMQTYYTSSRIKKYILRKLTKLSDVCLSISERNSEYFLNHEVDKNKIYSIPHVVDNKHFINVSNKYKKNKKLIKNKLGIPKNGGVVLYASKIIKRKRLFDLIKAFEGIDRKNLYLVIVGTGEEEGKIKEYCKKNKVENVKFLGFLNQSELPKIYAISDIFILPSEREPWGLVLNEVMCSSVPIITTKEVGAVPELIKHGITGLTYETGNICELTEYIKSLLDNRELRTQIGNAGFSFISRYNYHLFSKRLVEILDEVIE